MPLVQVWKGGTTLGTPQSGRQGSREPGVGRQRGLRGMKSTQGVGIERVEPQAGDGCVLF